MALLIKGLKYLLMNLILSKTMPTRMTSFYLLLCSVVRWWNCRSGKGMKTGCWHRQKLSFLNNIFFNKGLFSITLLCLLMGLLCYSACQSFCSWHQLQRADNCQVGQMGSFLSNSISNTQSVTHNLSLTVLNSDWRLKYKAGSDGGWF